MIQPGQIGRWVSDNGHETMWFLCERHDSYSSNGETIYTPKGLMLLGPVRYPHGGNWTLDDDIVKIVPDEEVPGEVWAKIAEMRLTGKITVNEGV